MRTKQSGRCALGPALGLLAACACARPDASTAPVAVARWREIEQTIRTLFPKVEHLTTGDMPEDPARAGLMLIDVREPEEYAVSRLPRARNVPSMLGDDELAALIPRDKPVVVYCSVGWRSAEVVKRLQARGFTNVQNYLGSIFAWANAGRRLENDAGPATTVHAYSAEWGQLLREDLRAKPR